MTSPHSSLLCSLLLLSAGLAATASALPAQAPAAAAPVAPDQIDEFILREMERQKVKGISIAIIEGGKVVKAQGYGFTDATRQTPVTPATLFQAASSSKCFTAYAALRLAEQKQLSLDEDLNRHLTSWQIPENDFTRTEKVTLRRILPHMAGFNIGGFYGYPRGEAFPTLLAVLDGKAPAKSAPIRVGSVPGTKTEYSGGGYCVLQQWVIDVSGQPFADYMKQAIFEPLGMVHSTFECPLPAARWPEAAHGYGYALAGGQANKELERAELPWQWNNFPESAPAGLWTTPSDLALFVMDIQRTKAGASSAVLSQEMVEKVLTRVPGCKWPLSLGNLVLEHPGEKNAEFRFSGTNAGFQCGSFGTVHSGQGCVIMYNDHLGEAFPTDFRNLVAKVYGWQK
ncbi:MAG TPA: serine hydrolase domain-containing protein [Chthoniobacteraceae bacterium]|jgi:CubicO group peptidase (beta-lactamase class C family)|nr:serine hydrolase domain-containing protein [Chthoniobacteraceae bacterium]